MRKLKIYIVIPIFNEERVIKDVIRQIKREGYSNIIVVDDGSEDNSYNKLRKEKIILLRHAINRGKGAAVKTGIEATKILNADIVTTIDGDGQHDPANIHQMIKKIKQGYEVVLGSRFLGYNKIPFFRKIANNFANFFTWFIYGFWVTDSQSGFRTYSKKAIKVIDTRSEKYEFDSEIIKEIGLRKLKYTEIPINVRYTQYSMNKHQKQSFLNGLKTLLRMIINE